MRQIIRYNIRVHSLLFLLFAATVSGWGAMSTNSHNNMPDTLQEVKVTVRDNSRCGDYKPEEITKNMMCASATGRDSCQGDSGGPLVTGF